MKLILIRHGLTEANEKHLYCGSTDIPLSEAGRLALAEKRESGTLPEISGAIRVLTSGMIRCEETLACLFGDLPHETDADFREMAFGAFEMRSYEEMKDEPDYQAWITGDNEANVTPGGESGNLVKARVLSGLERLLLDGRDTLLVTHGGVIAHIMTALFPEESKNRYEWQPKPGGGYEVTIDPAGKGTGWRAI